MLSSSFIGGSVSEIREQLLDVAPTPTPSYSGKMFAQLGNEAALGFGRLLRRGCDFIDGRGCLLGRLDIGQLKTRSQ
jgi:hypothetical protein